MYEPYKWRWSESKQYYRIIGLYYRIHGSTTICHAVTDYQKGMGLCSTLQHIISKGFVFNLYMVYG